MSDPKNREFRMAIERQLAAVEMPDEEIEQRVAQFQAFFLAADTMQQQNPQMKASLIVVEALITIVGSAITGGKDAGSSAQDILAGLEKSVAICYRMKSAAERLTREKANASNH